METREQGWGAGLGSTPSSIGKVGVLDAFPVEWAGQHAQQHRPSDSGGCGRFRSGGSYQLQRQLKATGVVDMVFNSSANQRPLVLLT